MKSKNQKKEELKKLKAKLPKSKITVFTTFSRAGEKGLSVAQMSELKKTLRAMDAELFVTKKTLIDIALSEFKSLKNLKDEVDVYSMSGSVGLVLGNGDSYAISKKLYEFAKKNKALQFFGAIFEDSFVGKEGFLEMAMMPSKEVLIGRLLGMLTYPMRGLAVALSEVAKAEINGLN
jgi:large subunit ribosomal protein L10